MEQSKTFLNFPIEKDSTFPSVYFLVCLFDFSLSLNTRLCVIRW